MDINFTFVSVIAESIDDYSFTTGSNICKLHFDFLVTTSMMTKYAVNNLLLDQA